MRTDGIWANIFSLVQSDQGLKEILRRVPIFRDLGDRELQILTDIVHTRTYQPDEIIFMESEPGAGMYVIQSGGVDILLNHGSDEPLYLAQLESGDFFGEMALLGDPERSATARSRERSELIGFFHPDLLEIMDLHPSMGAKITLGLSRTLAERLRFTNDQLRKIWEIKAT
jgi:CRP/FNR family cyclic AMP-dependent transcriptional regulator